MKSYKKLFALIGIFLVVLAVGVFAETIGSTNVQDVVADIAQKKGIDKSEIKDIKEVDFENLPNEIKIENLDETNLAIYEVTTYEANEKPVYVITVSDTKFQETLKQIVQRKMLLTFGLDEQSSESIFLETSTGVKTDVQKGYVMMRAGSITGISTDLEVLENNGYSEVEIIIYKNGQEVGFRNTFSVDSLGNKKDYDVQSENVVTFEPGDIISVYAKVNGETLIKKYYSQYNELCRELMKRGRTCAYLQ